jgi:nitrous-oxide reductase
MSLAFQIEMPGFDYDPVPLGQRSLARLVVLHLVQLRAGPTMLEKNASQRDKDFIAAINWKQAEQCVAERSHSNGKGGTPTT